jgi:putative NADPH-quinone reductase
MNILVILGHPKKASFCHAIGDAAVRTLRENGHDVTFHDLYEEKFNPVLHQHEIPKDAEVSADIGKHCREIAEADGIVIIHPNWWGQPPAILKGWIDRVIRPGVAYEFLVGDSGEGVPRGLLKAKAAVVFNTSNTDAKRERKVFGDPLETLWKNCIFGLCGVRQIRRRMFGIIVTSTEEQRKSWLNEAREIIDQAFSETKLDTRDFG